MKHKVGNILKMSWGYGQTNVDFYEVTKIVGKVMIEIRAIASKVVRGEGSAAEYVVAVPGDYETWDDRFAKAVRKRPDKENGSVKIYNWGGARAYPWDGEPAYKTGAMYGH